MKRMANTAISRWTPVARLLGAVVLMLICLPFFAGQSAGGDVLSRDERLIQHRKWFHQASDLFDEAGRLSGSDPDQAQVLFRQAAAGYERLISPGGLENGRLYYNIGNSWFQAGDMGRAILNYRRAMQYLPNDPNLRQNLDYARNKRLDKFAEPQKTKVFQTLFFWHYDLSTPMKTTLFAVLFVLLWGIAGIRRLLGRPVFGWPFVLALVLTVLMGGSLVAEAVMLRQVRPGVILAETVTARKGNSENYAPSFTEPLHAGAEFDLVEERGRWLYVRLPDGRTCWVPASSAEMVR